MPSNADKSNSREQITHPPGPNAHGTHGRSALERGSKPTLQEQLVAILEAKISQGEFAAGQKLPSVRELAETYGVSRETGKLAVGILKRRGLVEIIPSRGAFVLEPRRREAERPRTGTIGFVMDLGFAQQTTDDVHVVYDSLLRCIDGQAEEQGFHLLTSFLYYGEAAGAQRLERMIEKVDGLFTAGLMNPKLYERLAELSIPVVSVLSNIEVERTDDIGIDGRRSYRRAAGELLSSGHRSLVYIDGPYEYYRKSRRVEGIRAALSGTDAGLTVLGAEGWSPEDGRAAFGEFLDDGGSADAVLAVNDVLATGVLQACTGRGLEVPRDVSILGAKNTLFSLGSSPQLSSLDYHFDEIAGLAVDRMARRIGEGTRHSDHLPVKTELTATPVYRGSCRGEQERGERK